MQALIYIDLSQANSMDILKCLDQKRLKLFHQLTTIQTANKIKNYLSKRLRSTESHRLKKHMGVGLLVLQIEKTKTKNAQKRKRKKR